MALWHVLVGTLEMALITRYSGGLRSVWVAWGLSVMEGVSFGVLLATIMQHRTVSDQGNPTV